MIGIVLPNITSSNQEGNAGTNIPNLNRNEDFEDPSGSSNELSINKGVFVLLLDVDFHISFYVNYILSLLFYLKFHNSHQTRIL